MHLVNAKLRFESERRSVASNGSLNGNDYGGSNGGANGTEAMHIQQEAPFLGKSGALCFDLLFVLHPRCLLPRTLSPFCSK